jgi:hypothetical protein
MHDRLRLPTRRLSVALQEDSIQNMFPAPINRSSSVNAVSMMY